MRITHLNHKYIEFYFIKIHLHNASVVGDPVLTGPQFEQRTEEKMNLVKLISVISVTAFSAFAANACDSTSFQDIMSADSVNGLQIGHLNCEIAGVWALMLGSSKVGKCKFAKTDGTTETYTGKVEEIGVDIGEIKDAYMNWAVFTNLDTAPRAGALLGTYTGLTDETALRIGLGANALVDENTQNIRLQPLSLQGNSGLHVALLTLEPTSN